MYNRKFTSVIKLISILTVSMFLAGCTVALLDESNGGPIVNKSYTDTGAVGANTAIVAANYATALDLAIKFFDANRCGNNVTTGNNFAWRGNCHTGDTLINGYHDAGDHVKFGLPASYAFAVLGMSAFEFQGAYPTAVKSKLITQTLRRFSDYFLAAYNSTAHTFYYDVGDGVTDHSYWGAPENQTGARTSWQNTQAQGYADIGGLTAAGLALQYLNYLSYDATYANSCLAEATNLYFDIKGHQYYNIPNSKGFYGCNTGQVGQTLQDGGGAKTIWDTIELGDKLAMAAAYLYFADPGKKATYWADLKTYLSGNNRGGGAKNQDQWVMTWNDTYSPAFIKAFEIASLENDAAKKTEYLAAINYTINYWKNTVPTSGGGMKVLSTWGNLRYNAAYAMLAMKALDINNDGAARTLAKDQVDYILGDNPRNGSYVIGFGSNYPTQPHHRAANPNQGTATYTISGMLLGGPSDTSDSFANSVYNYAQSEGGLDYNAGLVGALASMVLCFGSNPYSSWDFTTDAEGWSLNPGMYGSVSGGLYNLTITNNDPNMSSPAGLTINASAHKYVKVMFRNATAGTTAQIFWANAAGGFAALRSASFTVVANDTVSRLYTIDLTSNTNWAGTINRIRFDPAGTSGTLKLDYVRVTPNP